MTLPDHEHRHAALTDFQHNLVVTAGAGTGKTSLLVGRLMAALVTLHLEPRQVLAVTFTENAASEMRNRLVRMLEAVRPWLAGEGNIDKSDAYILENLALGPEDLRRVDELLEQTESLRISTFHGFCLEFLQTHARTLGLPPELRIVEDREETIDRVFQEHLRKSSEGSLHPALEQFEAKDLRLLAGALLELPEDSMDHINALAPPDFRDPLAELQELIECNSKARTRWQDMANEIAACYRALIEGREPDSRAITKNIPAAGKKEVGEAHGKQLRKELEKHISRLEPWILSDPEGVQSAVDFVRPIVQEHRRQSVARGDVSFLDLLLLTRQALIDHPRLRVEMGKTLGAILVDEFQDTDPLQYDVVFLLAGRESEQPEIEPLSIDLRPGVLFIVGDAKQSIYRFRRADIAAFARVVRAVEAQSGRGLELTTNFRSSKPILNLVNSVCERSLAADPPYQFAYSPVWPQAGTEDGGTPVEVLEVDADHELRSAERRRREGNILVTRIRGLRDEGLDYRDMAVLLRATTDTRWLLRPLRASGIPYVLDGSRRFYQRQEVILATALICVMARPHDPVATLAILRSSLSNATDAEILAHTDANRSLDFRLAESDSAETGNVAKCLDRLRELHRQIEALPVREALTRLITLPELLLAEGVGFEGAQRIANIERFRQQALKSDPVDLIAAADHLARNIEFETDEEESPVFDESVDAVHILTVHKAKGLEYRAVLVPDLARETPNADQGPPAQRMFGADGEEMVTVKIGDARNAAAFLATDAKKQHNQAEQRRLFYVAATRAKERLVLVRCPSGSKKRLWQDDLDAAGDQFYQLSSVSGSQAPRAQTQVTIDPGPVQSARDAHDALIGALADSMREEVAPSDQGDHTAREVPIRHETVDPLILGSAMHRYLALVDLARDTVDSELLEQLPYPDQLRPMAEAYHGSSLRRRLETAKHLRREVPLAFVDEGTQVHGFIDLILEEHGGAVTILDWKTDRIDDADREQLVSRYRPQLQLYARGVQRALDLETTPHTALHFLREDLTIVT